MKSTYYTEQRVDVGRNPTMEDIRLMVSLHPLNGAYATQICRKCGAFLASPGGNVDTAKIVIACMECPQPEYMQCYAE